VALAPAQLAARSRASARQSRGAKERQAYTQQGPDAHQQPCMTRLRHFIQGRVVDLLLTAAAAIKVARKKAEECPPM